MSQWSSLLKLTGVHQDQVLGLYSHDLLPMEVRQYLAPWIESQDWKQGAKDCSLANVQFQNLLEHLDTQYSRFTQEQDMLQKHNLRRFKLTIQNQYQAKPQKLAELIRDVLRHEKQILLQAQEAQNQPGAPAPASMEVGEHWEIEQRVKEVKEKMQLLEQEVKFLEDQQETFHFKYNNFQVIVTARVNASDELLKTKRTELQEQLNELDKKRKEVLDQVKMLLGLCETLVVFLQKELNDWHIRQKLFCIGAPTNTCLTKLESWVTRSVEVLFQLRRLLLLLAELPLSISYELDPLKTDPPILEKRLLEMLCCLLKISFVVDKQPIMAYPCRRPLVLKTSTQFSVGARLLVNLPKLKNSMKVSYSIDKDPPNMKGYRGFNVLGPQPKALEDFQGQGLMVEYKHLTLKDKRIGPGGKGGKGANDGALSVLEELHIITFTTQFDYQGLKLDLEAATLPFVVISNISQFVGAWASVLWFNLLSSDPKDLTFFSKTPDAPWLLLADALSWQFSFTTKRGLNSDQLNMLEKKLCGTTPRQDSSVPWSKFAKENMPRLTFTFWTWFDATLNLVKQHLEDIWNDGHVMGFLSRSKEESLLDTKMEGTFLLRFSESIAEGGITFSWVEYQENGSPKICSVHPYTKRELSFIPLTEIIRNYQLLVQENIPENPLKYLYPNIPKDQAFGQYYEHRIEMTLEYQKYLKRKLIMVSERQDDAQDSIGPGTPQHNEVDVNSLIENLYMDQSTDQPTSQELDRYMMNADSDPMMSFTDAGIYAECFGDLQ
ncbi:signal transducer and activator of transcription 2 [Spea bombifrons]|uniref:signal transducer and activator of transcription 2 n=1 Tax=Spea bombifrons TaxID=233779 RepID=UPI00234A57BE|nr:signal transducer and activator of transcription 2 [Spea bombifrons]